MATYEVNVKFKNCLFIKGNVPSSKNSKFWTGHMLISSPAVRRYIKEYGEQWIEQQTTFFRNLKQKELPIKIGLHFVRKTKAVYDWHNMVQLPFDLMQHRKWIEGDDVTNVICFPIPLKGKFTTYDKENPGVFIFY